MQAAGVVLEVVEEVQVVVVLAVRVQVAVLAETEL
jgi:hypothetical protein